MSSFWSNSNFFSTIRRIVNTFPNGLPWSKCQICTEFQVHLKLYLFFRPNQFHWIEFWFTVHLLHLNWNVIVLGKKTYENSIPKICSIFFCVQVQQRFWHIQIHSMETLPKCVCLNASRNSRQMMHATTNVSNAPKYVQWTLSINNCSMCPKWLNLAAFLPTEQKLGH